MVWLLFTAEMGALSCGLWCSTFLDFPEQPPGVLQIFDRLENIAEQMMPDKEKRSDGVPVQPAGVLQIIDRLENSAQQMLQG